MKTKLKIIVVTIFAAAMSAAFFGPQPIDRSASTVFAQTTPTPTSAEFDQKAAIAKLREQIKGHETEPASTVFKNIQTAFLKTRPAGQLLAVMDVAYSRSLGVNCTHCHVPDKWESDEKPTKQIARDMSAMMLRINGELLKPIKNLKSENPVINCTTCHRGEVKPALNLPTPRT
jgi:hypothetical protein